MHNELMKTRAIFILAVIVICLLSAAPVMALRAPAQVYDMPKKWFAISPEELLEMGLDYERREMPDSALFCFLIISGKYDSDPGYSDVKTALKAKRHAALLLWYPFYDARRSYDLYRNVVHLAEEAKMPYYEANAYNGIANILSLNYDYDKSASMPQEILRNYRLALEKGIEGRHSDQVSIVLNNVMATVTSFRLGHDNVDLSEVDTIFAKVSEFASIWKDPDCDYVRKRLDGHMAMRSDDYAGARDIFLRLAAEVSDDYSDIRELIQIYYDLASLYETTGKSDSAIYYARKVGDIADNNGFLEAQYHALQIEAAVRRMLGENASADSLMLRYYVLRDSLQRHSGIGNYSERHLMRQTASIDAALREAESQKRVSRVVAWGVTVLLAICIGFITVIVRKNHKLTVRARKLAEKNTIINRQDDLIMQQTLRELQEKQKLEVDAVQKADEELLGKILEVFQTDRSIYSPDFSVDMLAHICGEKSKTVSACLNAGLGKNFNTILNEYRIREMCRLLSTPEVTASHTIEAIAQEVGFKTRSTYVAAFKRHTGLTPSEYLKSVRNV